MQLLAHLNSLLLGGTTIETLTFLPNPTWFAGKQDRVVDDSWSIPLASGSHYVPHGDRYYCVRWDYAKKRWRMGHSSRYTTTDVNNDTAYFLNWAKEPVVRPAWILPHYDDDTDE